MTDLSPATAHALKAAGFPQPVPDIRQVWLVENNIEYWIENDYHVAQMFADINYHGKNYVFRPTAQHLLEALPYGCSVSKGTDGFQVKHQYHQQEFSTYIGNTLAEALATAYLALHPTPAP